MSDIKSKEEKFVLENETFEMLKALYDFEAVYPKTISFDENEFFILHQTTSRQRNWWQIVNGKGMIGFVPSNYVKKVTVEPAFLLAFLQSSIESLKKSSEKEINNIIARETLIQHLEERKANLEQIIASRSSPKSPKSSKKMGNGSVKHVEPEPHNHVEDSSQNDDESKSSGHESSSKHGHKHEVAKKSMSSPAVSAGAANLPQLIQESPSMSVLTSKLEDISLTSPSNPDVSLVSEISSGETTTGTTTITVTTTDNTIITKDFDDEEEVPISKEDEAKEETGGDDTDDQAKSEKKDSEVVANGSCISDIKHEVIVEEQDVYQIVESIRKNTNLSHELACTALRVVISEMEVLLPNSVVKYLEPIAMHLTSPLTAPDNLLGQTYDAQRLRIIFQDLADCKNDSQQRSWMLYEDETEITHYLTELVRILSDADPKICLYEMSCDHYQSIVNLVLYYQMENRWSIRALLLKAFKAMCLLDVMAVDVLINSVLPLEIVQDMMSNAKHVDKLIEFANLLTMVFCTGHKMPLTHLEHIKPDFVLFLLNFIENSPDTDEAELLPDLLINLILAFNLQFDANDDNVVMDAMRQLKVCKIFTEKILLLINREEDPVAVLKHTKPPINSVLKMFVDLYSIPETTTLFYVNDNKVLIDILVRQLSDLSAGDPIRKWYLELCRRIIRNTSYSEELHRRNDLMKIFTRIFCEETDFSAGDQQIVREILREFPKMFLDN